MIDRWTNPSTWPPIVALFGVCRSFRSSAETVSAVDDVSLELRAGEIVGLIGPSGSGKTTLAHLIVGWESPDQGRVQWSEQVRPNWAGIALVPQGLGLLAELDALQNVQLGARLSGVRHVDLDGLLAELGLGEFSRRLPHELSLGEQQRVAVARAVACTPQLLVADEPTAHQDEDRADIVMDVLRRVADNGGAVLVATHDERLLRATDRTLQMADGRLIT